MTSPDTAGAPGPSLVQDWQHALRYWLRGRNGVIALFVLGVAVGAALNWSWLVAVGIAPLLLAVLPCAVMCGLGLCINRMAGGSCATSARADTPAPEVAQRMAAASEPDKEFMEPPAAVGVALPDASADGAVEAASDRQPLVLRERE